MTGLNLAASEYSLFKEAALLVCLLSSTLNLVGFVSTAWAIPSHREYDPSFEGLGLWKYCYHGDDDSECVQATDIGMPGLFPFTVLCVWP